MKTLKLDLSYLMHWRFQTRCDLKNTPLDKWSAPVTVGTSRTDFEATDAILSLFAVWVESRWMRLPSTAVGCRLPWKQHHFRYRCGERNAFSWAGDDACVLVDAPPPPTGTGRPVAIVRYPHRTQ